MEGKNKFSTADFLQEESENDCFEWNQLKEVFHEYRTTAVAFSPETSLAVLPKSVTLCAAFSDHNLGIFNSDLKDDDTLRILRGHNSYINDIDWEPEGKYLASASDDHSLILWNCRDNFDPCRRLPFDSCVTACRFHVSDKDKMLIGTKNGVIRYYNIETDQIILSFETSQPLMAIDWAPSNYLIIAAISGSEVTTWNLRKTDRPVDTKEVYENSGRIIRFSPVNEHLTASIGCPNWTLKVLHTKSQLPKLCISLDLFGGLCWHHRLPYIAAAFDRKLAFWNVLSK